MDYNSIACLALHLGGASLTKMFRYHKNRNYMETGLFLYENKFQNLLEKADSILQKHLQLKISVLTINDPEYPIFLKKSLNPPLCLFYTGDLSLLENPRISIVGTRKPSIFGSLWIHQVSKHLSKKGIVLVSGLANGIDSIVHFNALSGGTIGVLPHSLDIWSPSNNKYLFKKALDKEKVLLFSEYPVKTETKKFHFVHRNRIIAGISGHTILAEAGIKSGALITTQFAHKNNRIVHVLDHELQKNNDGGKFLLRNGLAQSLAEYFPVHIRNNNFFCGTDTECFNNIFYIGNELTIFFNEADFSTRSLQPVLPDRDFEQCND